MTKTALAFQMYLHIQLFIARYLQHLFVKYLI